MSVSNQCALALDCNSPLRIFITGCSDFQDMGHLALEPCGTLSPEVDLAMSVRKPLEIMRAVIFITE